MLCSNTSVVVPDELKHCYGVSDKGVPVPKPPRSFDAVIDWANATDRQREAVVSAFKECKSKHDKLISLISNQ